MERKSVDALVAAEIVHLHASLRRAQGRIREALVLHHRAFKRYWELGAALQAGKVLISRALTLREAGCLIPAWKTLERAGRYVDAEGDVRVCSSSVINRLAVLCHLRRPNRERNALPRLRELREAVGGHGTFSAAACEGLVHLIGGSPRPALAALEEARDGYSAVGKDADAMMIDLEIAAVHLHAGRRRKAGKLAEAALHLFRRRGCRLMTLQALAVLEHSRADGPSFGTPQTSVRLALPLLRSRGWPTNEAPRPAPGHRPDR